MNKNQDILNQLKKRQKPELEAGFFELFLERLMVLVAGPNAGSKTVDLSAEKRKKPTVPEGFFDDFSSNLMGKIEELEREEVNESSILDQLQLRSKPAVPEGYFDKFTVSTPAKPSKGRVIQMRYVAAIASVAAMFALIFLLHDPNSSQAKIAGVNVTKESNVHSYDEYLTYMNEGDIINYMIDNNIDFEDEEEETEEEELFDFYGTDFDILLEEEM